VKRRPLQRDSPAPGARFTPLAPWQADDPGNGMPGNQLLGGRSESRREWAVPRVRSPGATPAEAFSRAGPSLMFDPNQFRALQAFGHGAELGRQACAFPIAPRRAVLPTPPARSCRMTADGETTAFASESVMA